MLTIGTLTFSPGKVSFVGPIRQVGDGWEFTVTVDGQSINVGGGLTTERQAILQHDSLLMAMRTRWSSD